MKGKQERTDIEREREKEREKERKKETKQRKTNILFFFFTILLRLIQILF